MKKLLAVIGAIGVAAGVAAAPAQADPSLCWNGFVLNACVQADVPWWGWNHWDQKQNWGHWDHGHGHWK